MFCEPVYIKLKNAGWTPTRLVDTTDVENTFRNCGYEIFPTVLEFLQSFGKLTFHINKDLERSDKFNFDAVKASNHTYHEILDSFSDRLGHKLSPIGEADDGLSLLVMDAGGFVYILNLIGPETIEFLAISGIDAVEALCTSRRGILLDC